MKTKKKIVLFGDGQWATDSLDLLLEKGFEIAAVVVRTRPSDTNLQKLAMKSGIKILQPESIKEVSFLGAIREINPDLNVSISYDQIIAGELLTIAPEGFVNFHAGMLPLYRGRNVVNWAILNGEKKIGLTAHLIDPGIDTGPIVLQKAIPISWTDDYASVLENLYAAFPSFVLKALSSLLTGKAKLKKQPGRGTYFSKREKGDEWIDWEETSQNIYNKIRAITKPGPGARTIYDGKETIIWKAHYDPKWKKYIATPGQVVGKEPRGVYIKTKDSVILLQTTEKEGEEKRVPNWRIGNRCSSLLELRVRTLLERIEYLESQLESKNEYPNNSKIRYQGT